MRTHNGISAGGGGGGGSTSYPGVTGDSLTPGGLDIAGSATIGPVNRPALTVHSDFANGEPVLVVKVGSAVALTVAYDGALLVEGNEDPTLPPYHSISGLLTVSDAPGNIPDGDETLVVLQEQPLTANQTRSALLVSRFGDVSTFDYTAPCLSINDGSDGTGPLLRASKGGATAFQVDSDGIRVHDKFKTGAAVVHVLGAYSGNAVPIYDESGTLLGYMPLYG